MTAPTLGGMLIVSGLLLFPSVPLWGYTRGCRWLWVTRTRLPDYVAIFPLFSCIIVSMSVIRIFGILCLHTPGLNFFLITQGLLFPYQWELKLDNRQNDS